MELKNYMEILMWQQLDDVMASHPGVCKCEKCRYDIAALTMNFLPPRSVVTDQGQMFTKIKALEQQFTNEIITAGTHAVKSVSSTPHHVEDGKKS